MNFKLEMDRCSCGRTHSCDIEARILGVYGREKVECAVRCAMDLKDRYTVLRLYYDLLGGESDGR